MTYKGNKKLENMTEKILSEKVCSRVAGKKMSQGVVEKSLERKGIICHLEAASWTAFVCLQPIMLLIF